MRWSAVAGCAGEAGMYTKDGKTLRELEAQRLQNFLPQSGKDVTGQAIALLMEIERERKGEERKYPNRTRSPRSPRK